MQTITTFRNRLADPVGTRRGPPLVRGPQFENSWDIAPMKTGDCFKTFNPEMPRGVAHADIIFGSTIENSVDNYVYAVFFVIFRNVRRNCCRL